MRGLARACKQLVDRTIRRHGYKLSRVDASNTLEFLLSMILKRRHGALCVVQIGANDGRTADPLQAFVKQHPDRVRGVVVEPVREYFEQLTEHYKGCPGIVPVNAAIHRTEKQMTIYRVDPRKLSSLPAWAKGIASFDPHHHERYGIPRESMLAETVSCMTLEELLDTYQLEHFDLLQIDTEGYDAEIIRGIDFNRHTPEIIRFEHGRLKTMKPETFAEICALLKSRCYELMIEEVDVTAYQPRIVIGIDAVPQVASSLSPAISATS